MKFVIAGAGGVGGYIGVRLTEAGHEVGYLVRGRSLAALRASGITLQAPQGEVTLGPQKASDRAEDLGAADAVIVTVKLYDLEALAPRLAPLLNGETAVVPLQNGVEAHAMLAKAMPGARPLKGTVSIKSSLACPGIVDAKSEFCRMRFGEGDGKPSARTERLAKTMSAAIGVSAVATPDIELDLWKKFVMLTSFSATACLARARIGQVLDDPEARAFALDAAREAAAVGRARGVALPDDIVEATMQQVVGMPREGKPSMLEDLEAGRRLELPWLSGAVVRLGREAGVATPLHAMICRVLAMHVNGNVA
jgi:2-dehydropantoate 2-reductase